MVLINGRQSTWSITAASLGELPVEMDEIRQIEVIKDQFGAVWFNAVGGVINIITYDPTKEKSTRDGARRHAGLCLGSVVGTAAIGDTAGIRLSAAAPARTSLLGHSTASICAPANPFTAISTPTAVARHAIDRRVLEGSYGTMRLSQPSRKALCSPSRRTNGHCAPGQRADRLGSFSLSAYQNTTYLRATPPRKRRRFCSWNMSSSRSPWWKRTIW